MTHKCPTCKKTIKKTSQKLSEQDKFFPFCSERCKLIDLGAWLDAKYRIPTETEPPTKTTEPPDTSLGTPSNNP